MRWYQKGALLGFVLFLATLAEVAEIQTVPVEGMSFPEALKQRDALIREYKENDGTIQKLTARNQQILIEINYVAGYLDAMLHVSRTLAETREDKLLTTSALRLALPRANYASTEGLAGVVPRKVPLQQAGPTSAPLPLKVSAGQSTPTVSVLPVTRMPHQNEVRTTPSAPAPP